MKTTLITFILLFEAFCSMKAKGTETDSVSSDSSIFKNVSLQETVIQSSSRRTHNNNDVYVPTMSQRKLANNGVALLEKLQLNGLFVDALFNKVEYAGGGKVVYCINGRKVELQDVIGLASAQIAHVEYNENPGARYKDASVVVNFKLRKAVNGGRYMNDLMEAVNTGYGLNHVSASYNHGHSEWRVGYNNVHSSFKEFYNKNEETYKYNADSIITQYEKGVPGVLKYDNHWLNLNYNFLNEDSWMFNVALKGKYINSRKTNLNSVLTMSNNSGEYDLHNYTNGKEYTNVLDVYVQKMLGKGQNLYLELTGTYIDTHNKLDYNIFHGTDNIFSNSNSIEGDKYSLIAEALYEKEIEGQRLSFGLRQSVGYTQNRYENGVSNDNCLHNSDSYLYAEWYKKIGKVSGSIGVGMAYDKFRQSGEGYSNLNFRPKFQLSYVPNDHISLRYSGNIEKVTPSLTELSDVTQKLDNFQMQRGNPQLNPATDYKNKFVFSYHDNKYTSNLNLSYQYRDKPIMETTSLEGDYFVRGFANQTAWQYLNAEYSIGARWLHGMLSARATFGMDCYDSRATDYHHSFTGFYGSLFFEAAYKFVALTFNLRTHRPSLYGETYVLGEDLHDIALTYFKKKFKLTLAMNNPFMDNYRVGTENWNKSASNISHRFINETSQMLLVKFVYNFEFGKSHKESKLRLHNEDNDSGVMKGVK